MTSLVNRSAFLFPSFWEEPQVHPHFTIFFDGCCRYLIPPKKRHRTAKDPELFCPSRTVAAHHSERRDPKQFHLGKSTTLAFCFDLIKSKYVKISQTWTFFGFFHSMAKLKMTYPKIPKQSKMQTQFMDRSGKAVKIASKFARNLLHIMSYTREYT